MVRLSRNMELIQTLVLSDHLQHTNISTVQFLRLIYGGKLFLFSACRETTFSLLLNNRTRQQVLLARLIRKSISTTEDKWIRGAPLPPATDMLISGKFRGTPEMFSLTESLTVPMGPLKRSASLSPCDWRQEREWPVWTHSQPLCIPPISVSSSPFFSFSLSLTQSLYLYLAFCLLHRSLFRGIRSSCAAQVMLPQMKQNGLFSPFLASLNLSHLTLSFFSPSF